MSEDEKPQNDAVKDAPPANDAAETNAAAETSREDEANGEAETAESAAKEPRDDAAEVAAEDSAPTAEERLADVNDQLLRSLAELENTRKRAARDRSEALKFGGMSFARDMLGVVDNLQRALSSAPENRDDLDETYKNILIGLEMTVSEITKIMEKHGVEIIDPTGEKFDYNRHQAMFEVPTDDAEPGTVVSVAQTGYVLHDRLIRPAMVGVAKQAAETPANDTSAGETKE